ncbi:MAG: DNA mismatch repair endonuclease MutL [Alistipes sp.]|jgi:DNA mismatch repair protein MutL|nr:DNA mismatch repair endonuclease MutL [Alistipes sp.]
MSSRIKLLPDSVANQIAAGEVVNRPASVVKELMENAVDAGAQSVTVNFRDGGRELIQIKDDGCGMSPQDARMAFERHATSKIAAVDDIYSLMTFGFRGEALASIAAVAQVELTTRQETAELGTSLNIDGGAFAGQQPVATPKGTQIMIRNLFYNVPARKKFLDRGSTEAAHILSEFQRVALTHPEIAFQLYRDDAPVYDLAAGTLLQRVVGILGKGSAAKLSEVSVETSIARVSGFIGRPASARQRNKEQFLFVNGRFFKSAFFHKAVVQAYEKLIPQSVQPSYFIYLELDPEQIDVNVHPQKTEVKFDNQAAVWQIVNAAVRETLAKSGAVPMMDFDDEERLEIPVLGARDYSHQMREPAVVRSDDYNPFSKYLDPSEAADDFSGDVRLGDVRGSGLDSGAVRGGGYEAAGYGAAGGGYDLSQFDYISSGAAGSGGEEYAPEAGGVPGDKSFSGGNGFPGAQSLLDSSGGVRGLEGAREFSNATLIGEGYAAALYGEVFVAVDLRRAREAVLFDGFSKMLQSGHCATQQLLFPERMVLSAADAELLRDHAGEFAAFGFDMRPAGEHALEIFGTPAEITPESVDDVVYEMLDELRDGIFIGHEARRERLAAAMARSGAGNRQTTRLSLLEAQNLLSALASVRNPSFTPFGKPVMAEITIDEIRGKLR